MKGKITEKAKEIIERKKQQGISPYCCTLNEIMREVNDIALEAMREMHQTGQYRGSINIHKQPMIIDISDEKKQVRSS